MRMHRLKSLLCVFGLWCMCNLSHAVPIEVDLELILAVDTSGSVDLTDFNLRRQGIEAAFRDSAVINAITGGAIGSIAATLWDFGTGVGVAVDWFHIFDSTSANAFADAVIAAGRLDGGGDGQANMLREAATAINSNDYDGTRKVVDIASEGVQSGEGCSFTNAYCQATIDAGQAFLAAGGSAINAIWLNDRDFFGLDPEDAVNAFEYGNTSILAGTGAFQLFAETNAEFITSIQTKILREIAPPVEPPTNGVPAPATLALFGLGFAGLGWSRRKKA